MFIKQLLKMEEITSNISANDLREAIRMHQSMADAANDSSSYSNDNNLCSNPDGQASSL